MDTHLHGCPIKFIKFLPQFIQGVRNKQMITKKQELFALGIAQGKSQRQAYKAAYITTKMKDENIDSKASNLMKNVKVKARVKELKEKLMEKDLYDAENIRKSIIEHEMAILNANFGDIMSLRAAEDGNNIITIPKKTNIKKFDMRAVQEIRYDAKGNLVLKLYDKQSAINTLMELFNIAPEEKVDDGINIILKNTEGYDK